jgi:hypothetical protein
VQNPPLGNHPFDRISLLKGFQLAAAPTAFRQVTTALTVEVNAVSRTSPTSLTFEVTPGAVAVGRGRFPRVSERRPRRDDLEPPELRAISGPVPCQSALRGLGTVLAAPFSVLLHHAAAVE